jgi:RimJ/RimL family protein N-acetyltransferase
MDCRVVPIAEEHIEGFRLAVDSVARERLYLAFLEGPPIEHTRAFVRGNLKDGYPQFVALADGAVVGWCDISSLHRPLFAHAGVLGMGIVSGYRGCGIGTALMRAALAKAKAIGLTRVELTVREGNDRARALYAKMGFVAEGVKWRGVRLDGKYEDLLCMALLMDDAR